MPTDIPSAAEVDAMGDQDRKVLENRLRRAATRQGLRLEKAGLRDPRAIGYGTYQLVDDRADAVVAADDERGYGLDLHDVALYLYEEKLDADKRVPRKPTARGRRTVEHMAIHINSIALGVQDIHPAEVDGNAMRDVISQVFEDIGAIKSFLSKVNHDGR